MATSSRVQAGIHAMVTPADARAIGRRQGVLAAAIGLLIADALMTWTVFVNASWKDAVFWFADVNFKPNIAVGALVLLLSGWGYGGLAATAILIRKRNPYGLGLVCSLAALLTTGACAGWLGYFQQGGRFCHPWSDPFEDYVVKPFCLIVFAGLIPSLGVGLWLGRSIRQRGRKKDAF